MRRDLDHLRCSRSSSSPSSSASPTRSSITGVAQVVFPGKANGSQIERDGKVVGSQADSRQDFQGGEAARYFQPRPSRHELRPARRHVLHQPRAQQQGRAATRSSASLAAYLALERRYDPGLTRGGVPVDAVTTSASGVDPHISAGQRRGSRRTAIAAVRRLPLAPRRRADRRQHRRPLPRPARRARRQRPRAQPRPRPRTATAIRSPIADARAPAPLFSTARSCARRCSTRCASSTRACRSATR